MLDHAALNNMSEEFLAVQFRSEIDALKDISQWSQKIKIIDMVSLVGGGLCILCHGADLNALDKKLKKSQKKNYLVSFYRKTFPLEVLKTFYSLSKPKKFSSLIFAENLTLPEAFQVVEEVLSFGGSILEFKSPRSYIKNNLVIGVETDQSLAQLKKQFKKTKFVECKGPDSSLLRFFAVFKPE